MTHRLSFLGTVVVCLAGMFAATGADRAAAQTKQGVYLTQASIRLAKLIDAGNGDGYALVNNKFSLGGGWLKKSEDWTTLYSVNLTGGKNYRVIASGDDDAKDVDLRILDAKMQQVALDDSTAVDAVINFTPKATGKYTVQIRLYDSKGNVDSLCISALLVK